MAAIVVDVPKVPGESVEGTGGGIDALGIRESIEIMSANFNASAAVGRSAGTGIHSDIEIIKYRDKSSPKLAQAAANNANLGTVTIDVLTGPGGEVFMTYQLENTFVARMEHETLDEANMAFFPHHAPSTRTTPAPSGGGVVAIAAANVSPSGRDGALSLIPQPRSAFTEHEVERVWLNASKVTWTFKDAGNSINETAEARLI